MENTDTQDIALLEESASVGKYWKKNFENESSSIYSKLALHLGSPSSKNRIIFEASVRERLGKGDLLAESEKLVKEMESADNRDVYKKARNKLIIEGTFLKTAITNAIIVGLPVDGQLSSIIPRAGRPVYSIGYKGILQLFSLKLPEKVLSTKIYSKRYIVAKKAMPGPLEEMDLRGTDVPDNQILSILTEGDVAAPDIAIVQVAITDKPTGHVHHANYSAASLIEVCRNAPLYKGRSARIVENQAPPPTFDSEDAYDKNKKKTLPDRTTDDVAIVVKTAILRFFKYNPIPDLPNDLLYSEEIADEIEMKSKAKAIAIDVTPLKEDGNELPTA